MIDIIAKTLLKSTGLFTAIIIAFEKIDLNTISSLLKDIPSDNIPSRFFGEIIFMFLCITIIYVGYYIFSDITKTFIEGFSSLKKHKNINEENKAIDENKALLNDLTNTMRNISYKLDNQRRIEDDPNRKMNEAMRPPRMM